MTTTISQARSLPLRLRVSLWMLCGAALGLPVDDLVEAINQQLDAAKRRLDGKRLRMTATARVAHATRLQRIGAPLRGLFRWIATPEPLIPCDAENRVMSDLFADGHSDDADDEQHLQHLAATQRSKEVAPDNPTAWRLAWRTAEPGS